MSDRDPSPAAAPAPPDDRRGMRGAAPRALLLLLLGAAAGLLLASAVQRAPGGGAELHSARRRAYVAWLDGEQAMVGEAESAPARRELVVFGEKKVVESIASYWRGHFDWEVCCGEWDELEAEAAVYRAMREDLLGRREAVAAADLFLLLYECRLPPSADQAEPCPEGAELARWSPVPTASRP